MKKGKREIKFTPCSSKTTNKNDRTPRENNTSCKCKRVAPDKNLIRNNLKKKKKKKKADTASHTYTTN